MQTGSLTLLVFTNSRARLQATETLNFGDGDILIVGNEERQQRLYSFPNDVYAIDTTGLDELKTFIQECQLEFQKILLCGIQAQEEEENFTSVANSNQLSAEIGIEMTEEQKNDLNCHVFRRQRRQALVFHNPLEPILRQMIFAGPRFVIRHQPNNDDEAESNSRKRKSRTPLEQTEHWQKRLKLAKEEEDEIGDVEDLKDEDACVICLARPKTTMLLNCLDMCVCAGCGIELMERDEMEKICPVCREPIESLAVPIK